MPLADQGGRQDRPNRIIPHHLAAEMGGQAFSALCEQYRDTVEAETGRRHVWTQDHERKVYELIPADDAC